MNPEFQRNLYLEFSATRLIGMPLFLATVFGLSLMIDNNISTGVEALFPATANCAIGLYVLIVVLWGARQAAENVFEELRHKTWDTQKRTAISAWSLTWGKLFGSTVFNWYGGCFCWLVYVLTTPSPEKLPINSLILLAGGLLAQGLSMLSAVFALRNRQSARNSFIYLLILFTLIWTFPFLRGSSKIVQIDWYDFQWNATAFAAWSLLLFAAWAIIGAYRLLAQELQIRTLPWVWLLFLGFLVVYVIGLSAGLNSEHAGIVQDLFHAGLLTLVFCAAFTYLQLFLDNNDPMLARRAWIFVQHNQWRRAASEIPCWLINQAIALPIVLVLSGFSIFANVHSDLHGLFPTAYLLVLRDSALILYFAYAPDPKRALGLSFLWLILLYGILPWLFGQLHLDTLAAIVFPLFGENWLVSFLIAACQTGFAGYLLVNRWLDTVNRKLGDESA